MFLKWCFRQGWAGRRHIQRAPNETRAVIDGKMTATEFFFRFCAGKLTHRDLSPEGNAFASQYYGDDGLYPTDYPREFIELVYVAPEEAHDFDKLDQLITRRRKSGVLTLARAVSFGYSERVRKSKPVAVAQASYR